jgi:hypothetical protein
VSYDLIPVPVWRLGKDGHCGRVVKITAPDESWTVVGVLHESHVTVGYTLWFDGSPPSDWDGRVELRVGPWRAEVPGRSTALVEIPRKALPGPESEVLEGELVQSVPLELEELVSRETD